MKYRRSDSPGSRAMGFEGERPRRTGGDTPRNRRCRPGVECLEGRQLLSAITEFPVPAALPLDVDEDRLTLAADGNLWFPVSGGIGRITPSGAITEFALPAGVTPGVLTVGTDGNLWFAETAQGSSGIGRITASGVITSFPLPTAGDIPGDLTVGSDGNLWFSISSYATNPPSSPATAIDIGRITTSGVITAFSVPEAGFEIFSMTLGPDGNIWFTEVMPTLVPPYLQDNPAIGRVTPAGVITNFSVPDGLFPTSALTVASDGNLWFDVFNPADDSENGQGQVDRITPSGTITEFALPVGVEAGDLTVAPDGSLWFPAQGYSSNAIDRITTSGVITQFPLPSNALGTVDPSELTVGSDGALYFLGVPSSLGQGGVLGRITPSGDLTEVVISQAINDFTRLTVGSDGNLWFPDSSAGKIARINLAPSRRSPPSPIRGTASPRSPSISRRPSTPPTPGSAAITPSARQPGEGTNSPIRP